MTSLGPSAATFTRARYKLDIFMMIARREFWRSRVNNFASHWLSLCTLPGCADSCDGDDDDDDDEGAVRVMMTVMIE